MAAQHTLKTRHAVLQDYGEASTIDANNQYYTSWMYPYSGAYGSGAPSKVNHFWPVPGNHDCECAACMPVS